MRFMMTMLLLSLSAGFITASLANYFFNPDKERQTSLGSLLKPTPSWNLEPGAGERLAGKPTFSQCGNKSSIAAVNVSKPVLELVMP